jgi:hypothetical protein
MAHIWLLTSDILERVHRVVAERVLGHENAVARSRPRSC